MDDSKALEIVTALANGVNPLTGEMFAADSPYQSGIIVRALFVASQALQAKSPARSRSSAGNAGKPWTSDEDRKLLAEFDGGSSMAELAQLHGRTTAGIEARLARHGRVEASRQRYAPPRGQAGNTADHTNGMTAGQGAARPASHQSERHQSQGHHSEGHHLRGHQAEAHHSQAHPSQSNSHGRPARSADTR
jgi:hypothetical protein